jgi:hypothetical protein
MNLNELEKLAKAATPGPWIWVNPEDDSDYEGSGYASLRTVSVYGENKTEVINGLHYSSFALPKFICDAEEIGMADAEFIAAANPDTIKQLCLLLKQCKEALMDFDYGKRMDTLAAIEEFEK